MKILTLQGDGSCYTAIPRVRNLGGLLKAKERGVADQVGVTVFMLRIETRFFHSLGAEQKLPCLSPKS